MLASSSTREAVKAGRRTGAASGGIFDSYAATWLFANHEAVALGQIRSLFPTNCINVATILHISSVREVCSTACPLFRGELWQESIRRKNHRTVGDFMLSYRFVDMNV